jgi:hypothetical protein
MSHHLRRLKSAARPVSALLIACLLMVTAAVQPTYAGSDTFTTAGNGNWIAPAGVTSITVACWGGGGGGGADTNNNNGAGGGGGGGAYALTTYTVVPGNTYTYTVGAGGSGGTTGGGAAAAGGTSSFHGGSCIALGGGAGANAGNNSNGNGGAGGSSASSTGTTKFGGGTGAAGQTNSGGGGGGSAGTAANGTTATTSTGANAVTGGGPGGNGSSSNNGAAPASGPGGGGGGGEYAGGPGGGARSGGAGFAGKIVITYKSTPSLSITNSPVTYNGSPQAVVLSASFGVTPVLGTFSNILYNGSATIPTNAGSYPIVADFTPTDTANYNSVTNVAVGTFVINKATPTLSVNGPFTYDGTPHVALVSGSVPGTATNTLYNNQPTAPTDAGTYAVTANFTPGDTTNYNTLINGPAGNFIINKAPTTTTVTCAAGPFTYDGNPVVPCSATVTGPGLSQTLTVAYSNNVNAGTATASASFVATTNYLASGDSKNFTIDKATTTTVLTCTPGPFTYTGSAIQPCAATVTGPGLSQAVTVIYGNNINAGTASANANYAGTVNYLASGDATTFAIGKADLTLSVGNSPAAFNGSQQAASIVATGPAGAVAGTASNISYDMSAVAPINAGTYSVLADFAPGDTTNYNNVTGGNAGSFVIQPAATTTAVTCAAGPFIYSGTVFEPCSAVTTGPGDLNQALTVVYLDNLNAGTASASASFDGTPNYQASSDSKTFPIEKATPTLSITGASPTYDGTQHAATVEGSVPGTVSNIQYDGSATEPTNAGTYAVTADFAPTDATNYNTLTNTQAGSFVINKATPTLSIDNSPVDYDGTPKNANVVGSVPGTVANLTYNGSSTPPIGPGTFGVNADFTPTDVANYNTLTNAPAGNFVIQQIGVPTLSVANSPRIFNGAPQAAEVLSSVEGTLSNVLYNGSATVPTDAGSYNVTADFTPVDTVNYQTLVGATAGTLVIQKAATTTTVVCGAGPFTYNGTAFTPCTASVTGPIGLNQVLTVVYANNTNAGTASASASYAGTTNYLASNNTTTFTINKANATLLVTNSPVTYDGTPKTANVGSSIPGTVSNIRYNGSATAPNNAGTYAITADFVPANTTNFSTLSSANAGNFVIQKAGTPTLSVSNSPVTFDGTPKAATVVGSVAGTVSNVKYNGSATVPTGAGTYVITADFVPTNANMNSVVGATAGSFTIVKAATATTLDCGVGTFPYTGAALTPCTATVTGTGGLNQSVSVTYVGNVDVGTAAVNAKYAGSANYLASSAVDTFTIAQAATATVVTCAPGPFTVTGTAIEPCTAVVTGPGGLSQSLPVVYSNNVAVGTASATASYAGGASYLPSSDTEVFIIGEAVDSTVFLHLPFMSK